MYKHKIILIISTALLLLFASGSAHAALSKKAEKDRSDQIQRTAAGLLDVQKNTVSNLEFYTTNYGIFANPIVRNTGGGFWPRGSQNQYLFAGGIWFAAMKRPPWVESDCFGDHCFRKYVTISYNPNNGKSWMVPGRITDGDDLQQDILTKYRVYFSTDFKSSDGVPYNEDEGEEWPIWDASANENDTLMVDRYFGWYIDSVEKRTPAIYPKGPAFISGEDIFCTFKDTDLSDYDGGAGTRRNEGYPLRLQYEHTIYSWGYGDYKDFIYLRYDIINYSDDTLMNCWLAPVMDVDIAMANRSQAGAANDRTRYYDEDSTKNLAVQWSNTDQGERGNGFGYLGFKFLESPAVKKCEEPYDTTVTVIHNGVEEQRDIIWCRQYGGKKDTIIDGVETEADYWLHFASEEFYHMCRESKDTVVTKYDEEGNPIGTEDSLVCIRRETFPHLTEGFVRNDKNFFPVDEQLGLITMRNWNIQDDVQDDDGRYNFMSSGLRDGDEGAGDKRFMMSTGPFHIAPGDTVRTIVAIVLANPSVYEEADGSTEDLATLVEKADFAQEVYDDNFRAPKPPERAFFQTWKPYNNAMMITWDSTSEISHDPLEEGLDFMGYRLYRARRTNLDTFDVDNVSPSNEYTSGKGPFGWKQIYQWTLPTPFNKSYHQSGTEDDIRKPFIDSLRIMGPVINEDGTIDSMSIRVMRVAKGIQLLPEKTLAEGFKVTYQDSVPDPMGFPTKELIPAICMIDTTPAWRPWGSYYYKLWQKDIEENGWGESLLEYDWDPYSATHRQSFLYDSVLLGRIELNRALVRFNPLLYQRITIKERSFNDTTLVDGVTGKDTFYLKNTERTGYINGQKMTVMDVYVPYPHLQVMRDSTHIHQALDSVYLYLQEIRAEALFPDFAGSKVVADSIIPDYMRRITNNRTFFDIGDDNRSGKINTNEDPAKTEKLINNVDYYYKLLSFDEGDYNQDIESKLNDGNVGTPNVVKTIARAAPVGNKAAFEVISVDEDKIGGLYDFEFFAVDQDRVNQLFAGHILELEFQPYWRRLSWQTQDTVRKRTYYFGWYGLNLILRDTTTDEILYSGITQLEANPCRLPYRTTFTEKALSYVLSDSALIDPITNDTISFALWDNRESLFRSGYFSTGNFTQEGGAGSSCYAFQFSQKAYGTMGFTFDFTIQQFGGSFRPDLQETTVLPPEDAPMKTPVTAIGYDEKEQYNAAPLKVLHTQTVRDYVYYYIFTWDTTKGDGYGFPQQRFNSNPIYGSFNNGPGEYLVTFREPNPEWGEGNGIETIDVAWDNGKKRNTFEVPYLILDIENVTKVEHTTPLGVDVTIDYPGKLEPIVLPTLDARSVFSIPERQVDANTLSKDAPHFGVPNPLILQDSSNKFINKYNLHANGFVNIRDASSFQIPVGAGRPGFTAELDPNADRDLVRGNYYLGTQNRYYLTGISTDRQDTIDFVNMLNISGCQFVFNHAGVNSAYANQSTNFGFQPFDDERWQDRPGWGPEYDFKAGDQVKLATIGGALGYPLPGAKVLVKVKETTPPNMDYTDEQMDQIKVVPNPYFVSHQGQKSPYDAQIYFTKLPERCTIDIYTVAGDLIRSIEHDEAGGDPEDHAVVVWDLLSTNRQRVESQALIAVITSADGAQTVKEFSVVVGGYRLIPE